MLFVHQNMFKLIKKYSFLILKLGVFFLRNVKLRLGALQVLGNTSLQSTPRSGNGLTC